MLDCRLFSFSVSLFLRLFFRNSIAERKSRKSTTKLHLMNLTNSLFVSNLDVEFRGTRVTLISGKYKYKAQVLQYKRMAILHSELGILRREDLVCPSYFTAVFLSLVLDISCKPSHYHVDDCFGIGCSLSCKCCVAQSF